jgi:hypothetical protein
VQERIEQLEAGRGQASSCGMRASCVARCGVAEVGVAGAEDGLDTVGDLEFGGDVVGDRLAAEAEPFGDLVVVQFTRQLLMMVLRLTRPVRLSRTKWPRMVKRIRLRSNPSRRAQFQLRRVAGYGSQPVILLLVRRPLHCRCLDVGTIVAALLAFGAWWTTRE